MNLSDILREARIRLDEPEAEYQWSAERLRAWANEGQIEAFRRTRYLQKKVRLSLKPGQPSYALPCGLITLRGAKVPGQPPLNFQSAAELDCCSPGWDAETGMPTTAVMEETGKITLSPIPDTDLSLYINGIFEPDPLTDETQIPSRYGYGIVDYVMYRAYQVQDADQDNLARSDRFYKAFVEEFGPKSSAKDEIFNLRHLPYDGFEGQD